MTASVRALLTSLLGVGRLTPGHVARCNAMDEIWVPSAFHVKTFSQSGVDPSKLHVVPESVDVDFFDPASVPRVPVEGAREGDFVFLSVFKWERRKGWDVLLKVRA